jgi:hypothetical protein
MDILRIQTEFGDVYIRQRKLGELAITGIRESSNVLRVHENTIRRWLENGYLDGATLPTGVRRVAIPSLLSTYESMYGSPAEVELVEPS